MITSGLMSADRDDWETPLWLFRELDNEFHFTLDAAASDDNHKCQKYFTKKTDAIVNDWSGNVVFCNPPYGKQIKAWCRKAYEESLKPDTTVVMLIPARTDASWFHDYILGKAEIRFIRGRLRFSGAAQNAPFPSMVVVFNGGK